MNEITEHFDHCGECATQVSTYDRYCKKCGNYLGDQAVAINIFNNIALRSLFIFYFVYLFICLLVKHTSLFQSYDQLFWIELLLAGVTLLFAWQNKGQVKPLLTLKRLQPLILLLVMVLAAAASVVVSFTIREVNITFFNSEVSYYQGYRSYFFPVVLMIYSIAILPAFFEELAFRGIMYNYCKAFLDERLVVAVTAFLFAIMHLSLISMVWLLPFGFFIGHLRRRYHTLWYGIAFHFAFNLTACIIDLLREGIITSF